MDNWSTMESYLIQIGADIDQNSFNSAKSALSELKAHLMKLKGSAAPLALAAAIGAIGKAAYDTIKGVAQADMEYKKLAASMWTTKETAKALSVAMKTMGVSQDDIAWVPELRQQFFRLRAEMQRFATPADADAQLRYIREIGYDVQALFVRLKMLKEWVAYYLIQYLEPYIKDFKTFINWLLEKVGTDMPGLARKVARAMSMVLSPAIQTVRAFGMVLGKVYDFIASLPDNVKKWGAVFAAVGAVILAGPFGRMLMALSAAMLLIEDFMFYLNGWNSSKTLAPVWEALIKFSEGTGAEWMTNFKNVLGEIAKILDDIFKGLDLGKRLEDLKPHAKFLLDSMKDFVSAFGKLISDHEKGKGKVKGFWFDLGDAIGKAITQLGKLGTLLGFVVKLVSAVMRKDWKGAESLAKSAAIFGVGAIAEGLSGQLDLLGFGNFHGAGASMEEAKKYFTANKGVPLDTLTPESQVGFAALMKDIHESTGGKKTYLTATTNGRHAVGSDHYNGTAVDIVNEAFENEAFRLAYIKKLEAQGYYVWDEYDRRKWTKNTTGPHLHVRVNGYRPPKPKNEKRPTGNKPNDKKPAINETTTGKIVEGWVNNIKLPKFGNSAGFVAGSNEMAEAPFRNSYGFDFLHGRSLNPAMAGGVGGGFGGGISLGAPTVNINVNSTNASAEEIGKAAKSGVEQGMQPSMYVFQRLARGAIK